METIQIIFASAVGLFAVMMPILILQSRRAARTAEALRNLLLSPHKAGIAAARDMLSGIFDELTTVLNQHAARAENLERKLGAQNKILVGSADLASERLAGMIRTLENLIGNLGEIVARPEWEKVKAAGDGFNVKLRELLAGMESKADIIEGLTARMAAGISKWSDASNRFSERLEHNISYGTDQMNLMAVSAKGLRDELSDMQTTVASEFENVKVSSQGIENVLANNEKLLAHQIKNMENFTVQAQKLLTTQVNAMADTANKIGTKIRMAESSIEVGAGNLNATTEKLFGTSQNIKETFGTIADEIMNIRAKFQTEVGEFGATVVRNLKEAEAAATHTIEDSRQIATVFGESLIPMLVKIKGTVSELNDARDKIQPLSDLMKRLELAMPKIAGETGAMTADLTDKIREMADRINEMNDGAARALKGIGDTTLKLEKLAGESRQQMIELVSDYGRAAEKMKDISVGGAVKGAEAAPAATVAPSRTARVAAAVEGTLSVQDFSKLAGTVMEKLHELSVDLTRSIGAEIPDSVMNKYNNGDRAIFSKWFARMISSADKKKVRNMFKTDAVFRAQATQFVHGFAKMLSGAERTENKELVAATLLKTDLGIMYQSLRACLQDA